MFHSDVETFSVLIAKNMHILMLWYVISNHVAPRIRVKKSSLSFCRWYGKLCSQPKSTGAYLHSVVSGVLEEFGENSFLVHKQTSLLQAISISSSADK